MQKGKQYRVSSVGIRWANVVVRRRWLWHTTGFIMPKPWIVPRRTLFVSLLVTLVVFVGGIVLALQLNDASLIIRGLYVGMGWNLRI